MASTASGIRALIERWSAAIQARDIDRLMSLYSPDIVYFDVVPPLEYAGAAALRRDFLRWFDSWKSSIGVDIRELNIAGGQDVGFAHMLHRTSGILKNGQEVAYWVRATVCCRRSNHKWVITHEHISLPVDFRSGRAVMDLAPGDADG